MKKEGPRANIASATGIRPMSRASWLGASAGGLHSTILNQIGQRIVWGEYTPGDTLPNADDWSAEYGVSRTVLREVVKVLSGKGMVQSRPKTGTVVRPRSDWNFLDPDVLAWRYSGAINEGDVRDLFELRRAIEPMAAAAAAERATPEQIADLEALLTEMDAVADDGDRFAGPDLLFHQAILRMTGNELIGSLAALIETALLMSFRLSISSAILQRHSMPLHRKVVRCIAGGDGEGARKAMLVLLKHAEEDVHRAVSVSRGLEK